MDCLTFRRQMLEDPSQKDADMASHERSCGRCAGFAQSLRIEEEKLRSVLNVTLPAQLADRIQLAVSFGPVPNESRNTRWLSLAAAGLLAMSAGTLGWLTISAPSEDLSLERSVLHHVADESRHLYDPGPAAVGQLQRVFKNFGADFDEQMLGNVSFAGICMMRRSSGVHLVLRGEYGPVTVFFMPGEQTSKAMTVDSERFAGLIEPTQWGSIAVVGEQGEKLEPVLQRVRQAVRWPSDRISLTELPDSSRTT